MTAGDGLDAVASWPGEHRAAGWVAADGRSSVAGDADRPFALASVTKVLTAAAVLVATQEEIVGLDDPAGPAGSTVRWLLCHASGLPYEGAEPIAPPGKRRSYGNAAFEVLGEVLTERSGMPALDYVREAVCVPLGMSATDMGDSPAHGATSTVTDLLRLGGELLTPGRVLEPEVHAEMITPQLPDLAGVLPGFGRQDPNPWGLGVEIRDHKHPHWMPPDASPRTFGHFGQYGAFLWVDPDAGVACVGLSEEPFGDWAREAWPALGSAVLTAARG